MLAVCLPPAPEGGEDTDSAFISLTLGWEWSRAVARQSGSRFSRMDTNSSQTTPQALWEVVGVQTETEMDRETTYGRQRVNSELPPTESKGIKLVTEI